MAATLCFRPSGAISPALSTSRLDLDSFKCSSLRTANGFRTLPRLQKKRSNAVLKSSSLISIKAEANYFNVEDAKKAVESEGYTIVDVRDESQYKRAHISDSVHIPLFVENTDTDLGTLIKRQAHNNFAGFLFGLAFTKQNENFVKEFESKFPKDKKILLVCQEGLRSGYALEALQSNGFENLALLTSGLQKVPPGLFPKTGDRELRDAGKGGFVAIQTQFSIVLATILIGAIIVLQFTQ